MMRADALAALHAASFTGTRAWSGAEFAAFLADPAVLLEERPNGFLLARTVLDEAEILTLAVAPSARRQGIGARLLRGFHAAASLRGARRAVLEVAADNAAALALYGGAGYRQVGRRAGYYRTTGGATVDALTLAMPLAAPPSPEN